MLTYRIGLFGRAAATLAIATPVIGMALLASPAHAQLGVDIRIGYAPPPLPYYEQPPLPGPDYIWVPGTWAWSDEIDDYYWVPGYWDLPPEPGLLWTPAWWGWDYGAYRYHSGYWGHQVGWYGGIDYGHGYHGHGWDGGRWDNGHVAYNRAVINVTNVNVRNVYYAPVANQGGGQGGGRGPRVSYNGGAGGIAAQPRPDEIRATQGQHFAPTRAQQQRTTQAAGNPRAAASQITPSWHPPAVHRVGADGAPVQRGGAAPGYQQQRPNQNAPAGVRAGAPGGAYQGAPGGMAPRPSTPAYNQAARPMPQDAPTPYGGQAPRPATPAPTYNRAPPQGYAPPQGQPGAGRAAASPAQFHAPAPQVRSVAPPPPPRPAPPPPPRPAPPPKPQPQPQHNDRDHQNHP